MLDGLEPIGGLRLEWNLSLSLYFVFMIFFFFPQSLWLKSAVFLTEICDLGVMIIKWNGAEGFDPQGVSETKRMERVAESQRLCQVLWTLTFAYNIINKLQGVHGKLPRGAMYCRDHLREIPVGFWPLAGRGQGCKWAWWWVVPCFGSYGLLVE